VAVFFGMCGIVIIEVYEKTVEVADMLAVHPPDEFFRLEPLVSGANHDRRAVCIVGAEIQAYIAAQLLKTDPDVGLEIFHQMTDMDRAIGVRQCRSNNNFTSH